MSKRGRLLHRSWRVQGKAACQRFWRRVNRHVSQQQTLRQSVSYSGVGLHSGASQHDVSSSAANIEFAFAEAT